MQEKKDTLLIGDQTQWGLQVQVVPETEVLVAPLENPVVQGVEVIENWKIDTLKSRKDALDLRIHSTLTSFDSGSFVVPGRELYLLRPDGQVDTVHLDDLTLEYTTIPVDTANFEVQPMKAQMKYPVTFAEVAPWGAGLLALILLAWVLVRYWQRRRANQPVFGAPKPVDPPHVVALRDLDRIRQAQLWQNNQTKQFYTEVTEVLRKYIEDRYDVSAMESTTPEILAMLKAFSIPATEFADLQDLLTTADMVKFAKYVALQEENERAIPVAVRFVNATFLQTLTEEEPNRG